MVTTQRFVKANFCAKILRQRNCFSLHSLIQCLLLTKHIPEPGEAGVWRMDAGMRTGITDVCKDNLKPDSVPQVCSTR